MSASPPDPRLRLLQRLVARVDADAGVCFRLVRARDSGRVYVASPVVDGAAPLVEAFSALDGLPYARLGARLSDESAFHAFTRHRVADLPEAFRTSYWDPLDIVESLGTHVAADDELAGSIYLLRCSERGAFDDDDVAEVQQSIRSVRRALVEAHGALRARTQRAGAYIFDGAGALVSWTGTTPPTEAWLAAVRARVSRFLETGDGEAVAGEQLVRLSRLSGPDGISVLAVTSPTAPLEVRPIMRLSPLKRTIVDLAVDGATAAEIGARLSRSPETIRSHLKRIYAELGIGSRVELDAEVRAAWR